MKSFSTVRVTQRGSQRYMENPKDGGAWWAAVYGVAQSQTQLKQLSSSSSNALEY